MRSELVSDPNTSTVATAEQGQTVNVGQRKVTVKTLMDLGVTTTTATGAHLEYSVIYSDQSLDFTD